MVFSFTVTKQYLENNNQSQILSDAKLEEPDFDALLALGSTERDKLFHGYTTDMFGAYVAEFAYYASLIWANNKTNFETKGFRPGAFTVGDRQVPQAPRAVLYNDFRKLIVRAGFTVLQLCRSMATDIYNCMRKNGQWCDKYLEKGFKPDERYAAWPAFGSVNPDECKIKPTDQMIAAYDANRSVRTYRAGSSNYQVSSAHEITGGVVRGSTAVNPTHMITY